MPPPTPVPSTRHTTVLNARASFTIATGLAASSGTTIGTSAGRQQTAATR
jgi:hypothetical protein